MTPETAGKVIAGEWGPDFFTSIEDVEGSAFDDLLLGADGRPLSVAGQAEKAEAAGKAKDAEKARASAAQWREWADAASAAIKK